LVRSAQTLLDTPEKKDLFRYIRQFVPTQHQVQTDFSAAAAVAAVAAATAAAVVAATTVAAAAAVVVFV